MDRLLPLKDQLDVLSWALKGRLVQAGEAGYDDLRQVALTNHDHRPAGLVRVADAADVAAVLRYAAAADLEIAVRSGGHSVSGFSGTTGGLVLDLRDLNAVEIDADARTVWAGAGLTAGQLTEALEPHQLVVGFGDASTVGIGGITLGGGIGYLVRKHGLTIDSLLAAEVVTAAGEILLADETSHPDLFWALRGGGGNFGVVTRFKFRAHPLPAFTGGILVLPATAEIVAGFVAAADTAPEEVSTILNVMPAPPLPFIPPALHGQVVAMGFIAHVGAPEHADAVFAPFRALATPIADLLGPMPYQGMYLPEEEPSALSIRSRFMDRVGIEEARAIVDAVVSSDAPMRIGQLRVLGGAFARVPVEATAFAHRRSRFMFTALAMHGGGEDGARHDDWAARLLAALRQEDSGVYVNFVADEGEARVRDAYPRATWERLRAVKRRYDPDNLLHRNHNVPPV